VEPRLAFRAALGRYKAPKLSAIRLAQGLPPDNERMRPAEVAGEITQHLDQPAAVKAIAARLPTGSRLALSLYAMTETTSMSLAGLAYAVGVMDPDPAAAIVRLLELGLLAIDPDTQLGAVDDFASILARGSWEGLLLRVHPAVPRAVRTAGPEGTLPTVSGPVGHIRESDGLEPILRLAALWQRVRFQPLRQTQRGTLYKRDAERIMDDSVLAGPIADAIVSLPGRSKLWLELAQHVGLLAAEPAGQQVLAAAPEFWANNAVHLPQMIATAWLALRNWHEAGDSLAERPLESNLLVPYLRPALMLWLATLGESEWVALDDLNGHVSARTAGWDRLWLTGRPRRDGIPRTASEAAVRITDRHAEPRGRARRAAQTVAETDPADRCRPAGVVELILAGAAYSLGLVRAAVEQGTGRRVAQLTSLGRYVLALGPTPPPRTTYDQFLFVQPNFEVIAYRQGLTPHLVGRLSRFAWWSQIGAALELKLTRDSILFGLDGGLSPEDMLEVLTQHSQRPPGAGVVDAVRTWASRRERVTYYAAATLIEFRSRFDRDRALESWPSGDGDVPAAVAERFLLVDDERTIPFDWFRLAGARDYRRPPEVCVTIESDGVTMVLDPARSDLLVDAELSRFADELPTAAPAPGDGRSAAAAAARRFVVTPASLRRGLSRGVTPQQLADWYTRRTGGEVPPAVRLLLTPRSSRISPLLAARRWIISVSSPELLDGLTQHPATRPCLGDRLGPTSVAIPEDQLESLQKALKDFGIPLELE
jgi:hypothetical protein